MAMINIPSTRDDPNYRYKMPKLTAKVEGKGNGIKTNIMNMAEIARALKRPPEYCTKFCGHELGALAKFETAEGKSIVNGAHEVRDLQTLIDKFIEKYVLCPSCCLPEIDIIVEKKSRIRCHCNACGHGGDLDNTHKLATYMIKNPPTGNSTMGSATTKKKKKSKRDRGESMKGVAAEGDVLSEKAVDTASSTAKPIKKSKAKKVDGDGDEVKALDKKKKSSEKKESLKNEPLTCDSAEIIHVIDRMCTVLYGAAVAPECRATTTTHCCTADQFFAELRVLQVAHAFDAQLRLDVGFVVLFGTGPLTGPILESKIDYLYKLMDSALSTPSACLAVERYVEMYTPESVECFGFILHTLYMHDLLEEEMVMKRYCEDSKPSKRARANTDRPFFHSARSAAADFITWLKQNVSDTESQSETKEAKESASTNGRKNAEEGERGADDSEGGADDSEGGADEEDNSDSYLNIDSI